MKRASITSGLVAVLGLLGLFAGCVGSDPEASSGTAAVADSGGAGDATTQQQQEDASTSTEEDASATTDAPVDVTPAKETDCTNGSDDDGDGLVDCADSDCNTVSCVDPAPVGWTGPFQLYEGTADPGCSGAYGTSAFEGGKDLTAGAVTCSACGCAAPPIANVGACPDKLDRFTNGTCTGAAASTGNLAFDGQGTGGVLGGALSVRITPRVCNPSGSLNNNVTCALTTPTTVVTRPPGTWGTRARLCSPTKTPSTAGCTGGTVCQPKPVAPSVSTLCVYKSGTNACPTGFYQRGIYNGGTTDTRTCTTCTCGGLTSATLTTTMNLHACSDAFCETGTVTNLSVPTVNGSACVATPAPNNGDMEWIRSSVTALANATCGTGSGGAPTGALTPDPATAVTVCCLN